MRPIDSSATHSHPFFIALHRPPSTTESCDVISNISMTCVILRYIIHTLTPPPLQHSYRHAELFAFFHAIDGDECHIIYYDTKLLQCGYTSSVLNSRIACRAHVFAICYYLLITRCVTSYECDVVDVCRICTQYYYDIVSIISGSHDARNLDETMENPMML